MLEFLLINKKKYDTDYNHKSLRAGMNAKNYDVR